jgi:hypothetical protein
MRIDPNTGTKYNISGVSPNAAGVLGDQDIPIKGALSFTTEHRILTDSDVPNSAGNPTIKDYLVAEDAGGFNLVHMDQYIIVTSDA